MDYGQRSGTGRKGIRPFPNFSSFVCAEPVLYVYDVAKTASYYEEKLGFTIDFLFGDPPVHAGVSRGNWTGNMVQIQLAQVDADRPISPAGYLYIFVNAAIDSLHEKLSHQRCGDCKSARILPLGIA